MIFPILLLPMITSHPPFDLMFFYTPSFMMEHMGTMTEADRVQYALGLSTIDLIYPIYYSFTAVIAITLLFSNTDLNKNLILCPYIIGIVDLFENIFLITSLLTYPETTYLFLFGACLFTSTKWFLFTLYFLFIAYVIFLHRSKKNV